MPAQKKEKSKLHPRNKHQGRSNFKQLLSSCPPLKEFVRKNDYDDWSIDFANQNAVKALNKALLKHFYSIDNWDIPKGYLCPPIPGRADYIHHVADLLSEMNNGEVPKGTNIKCLDVGTGANCVYPIIGAREYNWSFIGTDIDPVSINSANKILDSNPCLKGDVELRLQRNPKDIFYGILKIGEHIDLSICNPPFHTSIAEAQSGTLRKLSNLNKQKTTKSTLNFGGQNNELWCDGGEKKFISVMIKQSKRYSNSCCWFSTLVSKSSNLNSVYSELQKANVTEVKTIPMGQGNKVSRVVAWTYLSKEKRSKWLSFNGN